MQRYELRVGNFAGTITSRDQDRLRGTQSAESRTEIIQDLPLFHPPGPRFCTPPGKPRASPFLYRSRRSKVPAAGWLLLPYLTWFSYATALNFEYGLIMFAL
jgi:hypothetical protein